MWGLLTWWSLPARGPGNWSCFKTKWRTQVLSRASHLRQGSFWQSVSLCKPYVMCLALSTTLALLAMQGKEWKRSIRGQGCRSLVGRGQAHSRGLRAGTP